MLICHLYIFFGGVSIFNIGLFVSLLLSSENFLKYNLNMSLLSNICTAVCDSSFNSLNGVLWKVQNFDFKKSSLSIFNFMDHALVSCLRNPCLTEVTKAFSYEFFQIFYRFDFTFKFMIHFELIFIYAKRCETKFTYLHMYIQFSQHHLFKGYFCSTELPLHLCRILLMHCILWILRLPNKVPQTWWLNTTEI